MGTKKQRENMFIRHIVFSKILFIIILLMPLSAYTINTNFRTTKSALKKQTATTQLSDSLTIQYDSKGHSPIFISGKIPENESLSTALRKASFSALNSRNVVMHF